jgi:hypothetical protein
MPLASQAKQELTLRTPNPNCPACQKSRLHSDEEWKTFHPLAGHGYTRDGGVGWSHPQLKAEAEAKAALPPAQTGAKP